MAIGTLHFVYDDNTGTLKAIFPTLAEARNLIRTMGENGEGAGRIETHEVSLNRRGVIRFIHEHFGPWIFDND